MKKIPKHYKIISAVLLGLGLTYLAYMYYDYRQDLRHELVHLIPVDINKDGVDDVIRIYSTNNWESERWLSLIEAYDQKNDRVLWKTISRQVRFDFQYQKVASITKDILVIALGKQNGIMLRAFKLQTGQTLWTYNVPPDKSRPRSEIHLTAFSRFQTHKNKLYFFYETDFQFRTLVTLDLGSGKEIRRQKLGKYGFPQHLIFHENLYIFEKDFHFQIYDSDGGQFLGEVEANRLWKYKNRILALTATMQLKELDIKRTVLKSFRPLAGKRLGRADFSLMLGLYQDQMFQLKANKSRKSMKLISYSLKTGRSRTVLRIPEHLYRYNIDGFHSWDLQPAAYHYLPGRYIPLFADRHSGKKQFKKMYIIDLKTGRITWRSKTYAGYNMTLSNNVRFTHMGYYFIELSLINKQPPKSDKRRNTQENLCLLILDANTGKFKEPLNYGVERFHASLSLSPPHRPDRIHKNVLYGVAENESEYWSYDLQTMLPAFPDSEAVQLPSARKVVEENLGPLP